MVLTALWIFGLMFVLELPDKTMFATVIMASRARARNVVIGAYGGKWITSRLPLAWIRRGGGLIFAGLGVYTIFDLLTA